jgi:hypothetical protein
MKSNHVYLLLNFCIAAVWLVNGLFCKVLHLVPRHEQIVARILGDTFAQPLTILIGLAEVVMAIWVVSRYWSKLNAILQILIVATMNTLEFILVPDLLLWGRLNVVFATCFILLVFYNEFVLHRNLLRQKVYV